MSKIGSSGANCVNFISHFIKHFPKIFKPFGIGEFIQNRLCMRRAQVYIAKRYHICQTCFIKFIDNLCAPFPIPIHARLTFRFAPTTPAVLFALMAFTVFIAVKASPAVANPLVFKNFLREIIIINLILKNIEVANVQKTLGKFIIIRKTNRIYSGVFQIVVFT